MTIRSGEQCRRFLLGVTFLCSIITSWAFAQRKVTAPQKQAHAHNDYLHDRPLLDALDNGFCSVEADIFLENGALLVAHTRAELAPKRTLQVLYLDPLRDRIEKNKGSVHPGIDSFTLLIDIKTKGEETYRELHRVLEKYPSMFMRVENGVVHPGPIQAIISGNRPIEIIQSESSRFVGIDGRVSDLDSNQDSHLLPLISDNWTLHFRWRGQGEIDPMELKKLREIVSKAHAKSRRVRFWASPDNINVWRLLRDEKVDLINTDDLAGLSDFLTKSK